MPRAALLTLAMLILLTGCSGGSSRATSEPVDTAPPAPEPPPASFEIPRLPPGPHYGIIVGFDDLTTGPFDRTANADRLLDEAALAGASISRIQVDWSELEPSPGVYDGIALDASLAGGSAREQSVYVTLSTLDTDGLTVPADLLNENGRFVAGLTAASPEVVQRFTDFLEWMVPRLDESVWALSLGNEVDAPINDDFASPEDALVFFRAGIERVRSLDPDIAVSVTLTIGSPDTQPDFTRDLMSELTLSTFNHYCLDEVIQVSAEDQWERDIALIKTASAGLPIMIQELGCPVGYGDDGMGAVPRPANGLGGDPDIQAAYFAFFDRLFLEDPQFRAATVFQLYDWSPELAELFGDLLRDGGDELAGDRLEEWLATVGLCRWADGTCRPAWDVFLQSLRNQAQARQ